MADDQNNNQYNNGKEFEYKKPKKDSPEMVKIKEENKAMSKRVSVCEGYMVAMNNDSRTQRKNMMNMQENMKTIQRELERTTNEVRRLNQVIEAMLREDRDDFSNRGNR